MTDLITLQAIPNQSFSVRLDVDRYDISIVSIPGAMAATITRNDEIIVSGQRCVAGFPIIPFRYLEKGNFMFTTENDEMPYYEQFGSTQFLYFTPAEELSEIRGT